MMATTRELPERAPCMTVVGPLLGQSTGAGRRQTAAILPLPQSRRRKITGDKPTRQD